MPRNSAGIYALPLPPVVTGTPIAAAFENTTDGDIATELTNSLDRNGRGGMLAPFKIADGVVGAPGMAFTQDADNGIYRIGPDDWALAAGGAKLMEFTPGAVALAGTLAVAGLLTPAAGIAGNVTGNLTGGVSTTLPARILANGTVGAIKDAPSTGGPTPFVVSSAAAADAAFIGFNRTGTFVSFLGIDADNRWKVGGGSMGALSRTLLHEGNSFILDANGIDLIAGGRGLTIGPVTVNGSITATGTVVAGGGFTGPLTVTNLSIPGTLSVGGASSMAVVNTNDLYTTRNNNTGVHFFGNAGSSILYQNGAWWQLSVLPVSIDVGLSIGAAATPPISGAFLDVKSAAGFHTCAVQGALYGGIAALNDAGSSYRGLHLGGGVAVVPFADNVTDFGSSGGNLYRWKQIYAFNTSILSSDARNKKDVQLSPLGLAFINALRPVAYKWIVGENKLEREAAGEEPVPEHWDLDGTHHPASTRTVYRDKLTPVPGTRTHFGLIAQEVAQVLQTLGAPDFAGYVQLDMSDPNSELGLRYGEFIAPLIRAVQELTARVVALEP